jgi:hypothetical protein
MEGKGGKHTDAGYLLTCCSGGCRSMKDRMNEGVYCVCSTYNMTRLNIHRYTR